MQMFPTSCPLTSKRICSALGQEEMLQITCMEKTGSGGGNFGQFKKKKNSSAKSIFYPKNDLLF